jgi:hypothetical protein
MNKISKELTASLVRMQERMVYIHLHQEKTQEIFTTWAKLSCLCEGWDELKEKIQAVIDWLTNNRGYFPNYLAHIESWNAALQIAKERAKAKQFILRCPGRPDRCNNAGYCFNLKHMDDTHKFEAANAEQENLCRVILVEK